MSNQGKRQQSARNVTGTESTYEGDFQALFDEYNIDGTTYNERLLGYLSVMLREDHDSLPDAQTAFAIANGVSCWNELGEFDASYSPPEPPPPTEPTPYDRQLPDPDGMDNYETTFEILVEGGVIIGIAGKDNANNLSFTVSVDGEPIQVLSFSGADRPSSSFTFIGAVPELPIGTHTLKITMNGDSSAGTAALRIIETDPMPEGWLGEAKGSFGLGTANGVSIGLPNTEIGSTIISIAAWADRRAFEPVCRLRISADVYEDQQTVRADLIRDITACGFFRTTTISRSPYFSMRAANPSHSWSVSLVELRGVTLRP